MSVCVAQAWVAGWQLAEADFSRRTAVKTVRSLLQSASPPRGLTHSSDNGDKGTSALGVQGVHTRAEEP